ncbi:hypothetical protein HK102_010400 [Quaeritorhiza haematococci]|nr:hypothetical protein HK102_010400 [Quaeritorhiza haematococci]
MGPNANVKAQEVEVEEIDYHESLARVNPVVPDPRLTIGDWAQDLIKILSPPAPPSPSPSSTSSTPPTPPTPASTALPTLLPSSSFPVIIVAASMGVWVSLLAAKHLPHRVAGIIGIGGSMSFPSRILGSLADEERKRLDHLLDLYHWELETEKDGAYSDPSPQIPVINRPTTYHDHHPSTQIPYSYQMLRDSQSPSVSIHKDFSVRIPIHLIHGLDDTDVPWSDSVEIAECVASRDVKVTLLKGGDHRLSREEDLECLARAVEDMIERVSLAGGVG